LTQGPALAESNRKKKEGPVKIVLASDHAGFELKKEITAYLDSKKIANEDVGCHSAEQVDYVDFAEAAMEKLTAGDVDRAILVCGTGLGMTIAANKFRGIRATPCLDEYMAEMSRAHNDSNCLTLGGRILPKDEALLIVKVWLETDFLEGRHQDRLEKIRSLEERNFK
jgi:ribose 5-phosphate isomerase B